MDAASSTDLYLRGLRPADPSRPRIAFLDLDRTLVAGYTMAAFVFEQVRQGLLSPAQVARQSMNYAQYGRGRIPFEQLVGDAAADFRGIGVDQAERFAAGVFASHVEPFIYREARALIERHRRLGDALVMVTSATQFQAEPVARHLGIGQVCCTRLAARRGILDGTLAGLPCFGPGKAAAGRRMARRLGARLEDCFFYTDSADDLPLLDTVGQPVAVNAQPALALRAARAGWTQLHFSSRAAPSLQGAVRTGMACNALLAAAAAGGAAWLATRSARTARNRMMSVLGDVGTSLAGVELAVAGGDNLEAARPAVFVFNHQSMLDAVLLAQLLRHDLTAFCKRELAANPVLGPLMRAAGAIFVDRADTGHAREPLALGIAALRAGRSVAIAPEGTRSSGTAIAPFRHGAFVMARKAGVPVIPVVLHNSGDAMPRGSLLLQPATVQVTVLPPLDVPSWRASEFGERIGELEARYRALLAA